MPKISVIIPVYNTEKYLRKCLDSVVNQTYQDLEIIIVNDGSTDNSEMIINEYKGKYPEKIKYFKKENGGLSDARNYGIMHSKGEYIAFVDSDDYIDKKLFESLKEEMNKNTELIKFKLIKIDEENKEMDRVDGPIFTQKTGEAAFNSLVFKDILLEPACLYLYKKYIFDTKEFMFESKKYHEDFGLIPLIILKSKTVSSLNIYGYYYMERNGSITRNNNYKDKINKANDLLFYYDNIKKKVGAFNILDKTRKNIYAFYTNAILTKIKELENEELYEYLKEIKKRKLIDNLQVKNLKQLLKKIILTINIKAIKFM